MTVVLYLLIFAGGAAAGIFAWITLTTEPANPTEYIYYRGGYHDGHRDGAVGIWRGGPIR